MAAVGMLIERIVIRPVLGYPTFTVVMITIGIGYVAARRRHHGAGLGHRDLFAARRRSATACCASAARCSRSSSLRPSALTAALCLVLYLFFRFAKLGVAMQATSQNQLAAYYMGIPVQRVNMLIWGLAAAVAAFGGILLAPVAFVHSNMGFIGLKAFPAAVVGGFGSVPGAIVGGLIIGVVEALAGFYLPGRLQGRRGLRRGAGRAAVHAVRHFRRERHAQERSVGQDLAAMRFIFKTDYDAGHPPVPARRTGLLVRRCSACCCSPRRIWSAATVLSQLHFICIYAIVGLGLMLLVGYTGQISLGHAAFLGVGAYTEALLQAAGVPFIVSLDLRGAVLRRGRHHRRPAGAAAEGHLSRDRDASRSTSSSRRSSRAGRSSPAATAASCSSRSRCSASG